LDLKLGKIIEENEKQIISDKMKLDYCNENNIKLYIIKYNDNLDLKLGKIIEENEKKD
jgi:hypothetical protein